MPLKEHFENTLKLSPSPTPLPRMILCSLCTTLPLVLGHSMNQMPYAIFGSLIGFTLCLNDHFGPLKHRIQHLIVTYFFLSLAFFLGTLIVNNTVMITLALFLVALLLGKTKSYGVELERMLLFTALQLITGSSSPLLKAKFLWILLYFSIALINYIVCLTLVFLFSRHGIEFIESKRKTLKKVMTQKESSLFATIFAITVTTGFLLAKYIHITRGYWVVGTTLIVMLPNSTASIYKSAQRLFGTITGVLIGCLFIKLGNAPIALMFFCMISAFFAPLGLIRNYWLGNLFIAALILFLLQMASSASVSSLDLAVLRITDIALGCLLGIIGTLVHYLAGKTLLKKA